MTELKVNKKEEQRKKEEKERRKRNLHREYKRELRIWSWNCL